MRAGAGTERTPSTELAAAWVRCFKTKKRLEWEASKLAQSKKEGSHLVVCSALGQTRKVVAKSGNEDLGGPASSLPLTGAGTHSWAAGKPYPARVGVCGNKSIANHTHGVSGPRNTHTYIGRAYMAGGGGLGCWGSIEALGNKTGRMGHTSHESHTMGCCTPTNSLPSQCAVRGTRWRLRILGRDIEQNKNKRQAIGRRLLPGILKPSKACISDGRARCDGSSAFSLPVQWHIRLVALWGKGSIANACMAKTRIRHEHNYCLDCWCAWQATAGRIELTRRPVASSHHSRACSPAGRLPRCRTGWVGRAPAAAPAGPTPAPRLHRPGQIRLQGHMYTVSSRGKCWSCGWPAWGDPSHAVVCWLLCTCPICNGVLVACSAYR